MKNFFAVLFGISLLVNLALTYFALNFATTADDMGNEIAYRETQMGDLEKILPSLLNQTSKEDILAAAKRHHLETFEKKEDGGIYVGQSGFLFSNNRVSSVVLK